MTPAARQQWILEYLKSRSISTPYAVDVCNAYFVDDYLDATNARCAVQPYGAAKCPTLGRDLSLMHARGILTRSRVGLSDMRWMGFPSWVYSYKVKP